MKNSLVMAFLLTGLFACKTPLQEYTFETIIWTAAWSPDGQYVASGGNAEVLTIWSSDTWKVAEQDSFPQTITNTAWHPTLPKLAVTLHLTPKTSVIIDMETKQKTELPGVSPEGARAVAWSPDGQWLALGDNEGYLSLYTPQGALERQVKVDPKAITGLSWHPDGQQIATVGSKLGFYNLETEGVETIAHRDTPVLMLSVAWHPSGTFLALGDYGDAEQKLAPLLQFRKPNGALIKSIQKSRAEYRNLRWSPDGKMLASASDGIRLWSVDGKLLGHALKDQYLWGLDWSPEGEQLVVTTAGGLVKVLGQDLKVLFSRP
jgi:WD40 repeat protein